MALVVFCTLLNDVHRHDFTSYHKDPRGEPGSSFELRSAGFGKTCGTRGRLGKAESMKTRAVLEQLGTRLPASSSAFNFNHAPQSLESTLMLCITTVQIKMKKQQKQGCRVNSSTGLVSPSKRLIQRSPANLRNHDDKSTSLCDFTLLIITKSVVNGFQGPNSCVLKNHAFRPLL